MRFVTPEIHAIMDYVMGFALILSPFVLDFYSGSTETGIPCLFGLMSISITALTDFKFAWIRAIPLKIHLWYDLVAGIFLMLSPWLFDFYRIVYMPHVIFGALQVIASLTTRTSEIERRSDLEFYKKVF
jgi:hypothetical protein